VRERLKKQVVEMRDKFPGFRPGLAILQVLFSLMTTTENLCCFAMVSAQLMSLTTADLQKVMSYKEQKSRVPCGKVTQFCDIFSPSTGAKKHFEVFRLVGFFLSSDPCGFLFDVIFVKW